MTAAFMSSFNSSLVVASHVFMTRPANPNHRSLLSGLDLYRATLCIGFSIVACVSLVVFNQGANPYLVGNLMVGPFCILGGLVLGTAFMERPFAGEGLFGVVLALLVGWFAYMANLILTVHASSTASLSQVDSIPAGSLLFFLCAGLAWSRRAKE